MDQDMIISELVEFSSRGHKVVSVDFETGHVELVLTGVIRALTAQERDLADEGRRVDAVVSIRARTGLGLMEAKTLLDNECPPRIE